MAFSVLFGTGESRDDIAVAEGLRLHCYGDPVLARKSAPITAITPEIRVFAEAMIEAMYRFDGVGLAAPQVGRNLRLIVLDTQPTDEPLPPDASLGERMLTPLMPVALVNPEILDARGELSTREEGCLSFPKIFGDVTRPERIVFRAQLLDGSTVQAEAGGLLARCLQHELDHLDGIVFPDRMSQAALSGIEKHLQALKRKTRKALPRKDR